MSKHNLFIWKDTTSSRRSNQIGQGGGQWVHLDYPHLPIESLQKALQDYAYNFNPIEGRLSLQLGSKKDGTTYKPAVLILNQGVYAARSMADYYYLMFAIPEARFKNEFGHYFSEYYAYDEDFNTATGDTLIFRVDVFQQEMPDPIIVEKLTREIVHEPPEMQPPPEEDTTPYGVLHLAGAAVLGIVGGKMLGKKS